jgi:hypothetical protein
LNNIKTAFVLDLTLFYINTGTVGRERVGGPILAKDKIYSFKTMRLSGYSQFGHTLYEFSENPFFKDL